MKTNSLDREDVSTLASWRRIPYDGLYRAANGFDESNLLGTGGFGSVCKGKLLDGKDIAIKVFNLQLERALKSFDDECEVMSKIYHRNLVKIVRCCSNWDFKALVLEYMPNGSLEKWLYSHNYFLDILQRLNIMIDVASALEYLHHGYRTPIVHSDIKPSNVMLDEDMVAHVGEFGIAKLLGEEDYMTQTHTLAAVGYMAPEYGSEGIVSVRRNVYSFGILLMETFTRKKPTDNMFEEGISLKCWVQKALPQSVNEVADANLLGEENLTSTKDCISSILELAVDCSEDLPKRRLEIINVLRSLVNIRTRFQKSLDPSPELAQQLSKVVQATPKLPPISLDLSATMRERQSEGWQCGSGPESLPWTNPGGGQQLPSARNHQNGDHPSFPMTEHLVFSIQHPPKKMVEGLGGGANPEIHYKRARSDCEDLSTMPPKERVDNFKTKLPGERILATGRDLELKSKLCKPWANALILKIMGRSHSLNFMIQKLTQKWSLVGQWQLTDLEYGYFVARFQFVVDLEYILTGGPWMVTHQYLVVQRCWFPLEAGSYMKVDGRIIRIEYENLSMVCFTCVGGSGDSVWAVDDGFIWMKWQEWVRWKNKFQREDLARKEKDRTVGKSSAKVHISTRPPVEERSGTSKATETSIKQRPIVKKSSSSKLVGGNGSRFDVLSEQMVEERAKLFEGIKWLSRQKEVVLDPNPKDDMEDVCEDSEVLQSLHNDVLNSDMTNKEKMGATSGAGKKSLIKTLSDFRKIYRFEVLAVLEPRISGPRALSVANKVGFSSKFIVDADGFSGGLWLLWNSASVSLEVVTSSRHTITFVTAEANKCSVATVVYANPSCGFRDRINANCLVDLGFVGQKFTWMVKRGVNDNIWCRLDRAVCSIDLRIMFPEGFIRHLLRINSDHCPIVLNLHSAHIPNNSLKPFRFEAMWASHADYSGFVLNCWNRNVGSFSEKLKAFAANLKDWNRDSFGCIFRRKRVLLAIILGIQKSLSSNYNSNLVSLECGDRNTKFFYLSTMIRRRRNKIEGLWDVNGDWVDDKFGLKRIAYDYFKSLFSYKNASFDYTNLPALFPTIDDIFKESICRGISEEEPLCRMDLVNMVTNSFRLVHFPLELNQTFIALIPKIPSPLEMANFRPISLYNTAYKIISKIIVSRLRVVMADLEVFHKFRVSKSKKGFLAWNIDLAKAYDKIQWDFIENVLLEQAGSMKLCLDRFCGSSGQEVSNSKSRVFYSSLVRDGDARALASICGSPITNDLGKLDKVNRNFLWGHTVNRKTVHLVNWGTVCTPKGNGGLGIKSTKLMNQSLLAKAGWRILQGEKGVWSQLLICKYLNNANLLIPSGDKSVCSSTWKGIKFGTKLLSSGINWRIGNSNSVHFWIDVWASDCGSLVNHASVVLNDTLLSEKVKDYVWNFIWKLKLSPKVLTFLWSILHGKILTNDHRRTRCLTTDSSCPRCCSGLESIDHLLRGWRYSVGIWNQVSAGFSSATTFSDNFISWIYTNLKNTASLVGDAPWYVVFALTIWYIWKWRCCKVFDINFVIPVNCHIPIFMYVKEWWNSMGTRGNFKEPSLRLISWIPSVESCVKLNVDGSLRASDSSITAAGVLRNHETCWKRGSIIKIGVGSIMEAELWGLYEGLKFAWTSGFKSIVVESDSKDVVSLVNTGPCVNHPYFNLADACCSLMKANWACSIVHIFREANRLADVLAGLGHDLALGVHALETIPPQATLIFEDDRRNLAMARLVPD
ncbi:hypothetical protein JRO89_XS06G0045300 [Xanthoceras sorbifolium]|uniref:Uncharacterized protein n=1 Tax=Xanthoceras sorbifolium TaxID=99658 RepID=A0ABQ8HWL9_9ROSI|nr:hypothetical protein JRO89_XS06G0045300 [Xanthoceras sorbifolium]